MPHLNQCSLQIAAHGDDLVFGQSVLPALLEGVSSTLQDLVAAKVDVGV